MRRAIMSNLKQAIVSRAFFVALLGMAAVLLFSCTESLINALRSEALLPYGAHMQQLLAALSSEGVMLSLPVLAALPYTTAFIDDSKSGYIKQYLPRLGKERYIAGKFSACALSGALAVVGGTILAYVVLTLLLLPMQAVGNLPEGLALQLLQKLLLLFASGMLWSALGLLLATLSKSRYMAYAGPFVICYALVILYERYFNALYILYPREWINPSMNWPLGTWGAMLLLLTLSGAIGTIFALYASRRLMEI